MKYLVSLNGKQYEVIVEHHTANVTLPLYPNVLQRNRP